LVDLHAAIVVCKGDCLLAGAPVGPTIYVLKDHIRVLAALLRDATLKRGLISILLACPPLDSALGH